MTSVDIRAWSEVCREGYVYPQGVEQITPRSLENKLDILFGELEKNKGKGLAQDIAIMIFGPPGIGKTQTVVDVANKHGLPIQTYIASTMDPTEVRGIPTYVPTRYEQLPPSAFGGKDTHKPTHGAEDYPDWGYAHRGVAVEGYSTWWPEKGWVETKQPAVYFFDELNLAPPSTQAAFYRLILEGKLDQIDISHSIRIAAGNTTADVPYIKRMPLPLTTRFEIYYDKPSLPDWLVWASFHNIHPAVTEYLTNAQKLAVPPEWPANPKFFCMNPNKQDQAKANPRGWERISNLIKLGLDSKDDFMGSLGSIVGIDFDSFYVSWKSKQKRGPEESAFGHDWETPGRGLPKEKF